jgi:hypothetical protein
MLVWFILFFIIILISFILALRSLGDYYEKPVTTPGYSLFLIRNPSGMTESLLQQLYQEALPERSIISFERLYKGSREALVVSGPTDLLLPHVEALNLLELEDYSKRVSPEELPNSMSAWEVGPKKNGEVVLNLPDIITENPVLSENEEFWWQVVLQPVSGNVERAMRQISQALVGGKTAQKTEKESSFQSVIRAVIWAEDNKMTAGLEASLAKIGNDQGLARLPQIYSSSQIVKFYQERGLHQFTGNSMPLSLDFREVLSLLGLLKKDYVDSSSSPISS